MVCGVLCVVYAACRYVYASHTLHVFRDCLSSRACFGARKVLYVAGLDAAEVGGTCRSRLHLASPFNYAVYAGGPAGNDDQKEDVDSFSPPSIDI